MKSKPSIDHASFRPLPFLGNNHIQTLVGHFWAGSTPRFHTVQRRVQLGDADSLVVHDSLPSKWQPLAKVAILIHGLGGCHQSPNVKRIASRLLKRGMRVVRVDLRGVGAGERFARRCYHGGCSDDVRSVIGAVCSWMPQSPIVLIGLSLGGNISLKLAGEAAHSPLPQLKKVIAINPPIDLEACALMLQCLSNRIYNRYFAKRLVQQVKQHDRHFPDLPRIELQSARTLRDFDELYTAPRGGFVDAVDYYRRASAIKVADQIRVPTIVLTARDDPFIAIEPFDRLRGNPAIELHIAERGGHLGFLGNDGVGGIRWAETQVVDWATE